MGLGKTFWVALLAGSVGCAGTQLPTARLVPPNVVVVIADDLGWNDVGFHGSEIRTPRLDALARESVLLNSFYGYPTCSPTRAMLLTGRNPSRFGIRTPLGLGPKVGLPLETVTLPEVLGDAGYETAFSGKWHLGPRFDVGPRRQGFQHARGFLHGQIDQFTHRYKDLSASWFRDETFVDEPGHATDLIAQGAVDFINRPHDRPFYLHVAFSVPHYPLQEDASWVAPYQGKIENASRRLYAASVAHMDAAIGRMLDALDGAKLRENTLVLFVSDNGGQKDWMETAYGGAHGPNDRLGDNRPLRGWKGTVYEGGIRLVALAHWRGRLPAREVTAVTSAMDLLPTVARLAGVTLPASMQVEGSDLLPLLEGGSRPDPGPLYWNTPGQNALRDGDWKLVEIRKPPQFELFNLASDPHETRDLAAEQPERVRSMRSRLVEMKSKDPAP